MARLSVIYDQTRFDGDQGAVRAQAYGKVLSSFQPQDLETAVDMILENWKPTTWERFPCPATLLESTRAAMRNRVDLEQAEGRRMVPEKHEQTEANRLAVSKIVQDCCDRLSGKI